MGGTRRFVDSLLSEFPGAVATIYDIRDDAAICEGTVQSLSRIVDFQSLNVISFFVMELEDGSVQADIHVRTNPSRRRQKGGGHEAKA